MDRVRLQQRPTPDICLLGQSSGRAYNPSAPATVSLSPGTRLGAYEVATQIGQGGMGEVYRARDTKLDRDVTLKVLPDAFASDPDRLARFQREAQIFAWLSHPLKPWMHSRLNILRK